MSDIVISDSAMNRALQTPIEVVPMEAAAAWGKILGFLEELISRFIYEQQLSSPRSEAEYRQNIRYFIAFLGGRSPIRADLIDYQRYLTGRGLTPNTVNNYTNAVKYFFQFLGENAFYPNICRKVKPVQRDGGYAKDFFSDGQIGLILATCAGDSEADLRDRAIILLMLMCGLRVGAICTADNKDIRQNRHEQCLWYLGKKRLTKNSFVILTPPTYEALTRYHTVKFETGLEAPLIQSVSRKNRGERLTVQAISKIVKERIRAAGFDSRRLTAHSFRHTAITLAVEGGSEIQDVQDFANHKNMTTTQGYWHRKDRLERGAELKIYQRLQEKGVIK